MGLKDQLARSGVDGQEQAALDELAATLELSSR
jgi:hypothetical protein